jgi:hypothetical protein
MPSVVRAILILMPLTSCLARLHASAAPPEAVARDLTRSLAVVAQAVSGRRNANPEPVRPHAIEIVERPPAPRVGSPA